VLRTQFETEKEDLDRLIARAIQRDEMLAAEELAMAKTRQADELPAGHSGTGKTSKRDSK
jgi:hypothetical protein